MKLDAFLDSLKKWDGKHAFGLESISEALTTLGPLHKDCPAIHVAGTNGKGSVCMLLAALLGYGGKGVGAYLSPPQGNDLHRFIVNGSPVEFEVFESACSELMKKLGSDVQLSLFEFYQLVAFKLFQGLDYQVVEVGLGGRLDASNILEEKLFSVITSIGLDHQHLLGGSLLDIAREKAGIIKGAEPVVVGHLDEDVLDFVRQKATQLGSECFVYGEDFHVVLTGSNFAYTDALGQFEFESPLIGSHQQTNLGIAIFIARKLGLSDSDIVACLGTQQLPGRFEKRLKGNNQIIFDVAHNVDAVKALVSSLKSEESSTTSCLFACYADKAWQQMINLLSECIVNWSIVCVDSDRGVPTSELEKYLSSIGVNRVEVLLSLQDFEYHEDTVVTGSAELVKLLKIQEKYHNTCYWKPRL